MIAVTRALILLLCLASPWGRAHGGVALEELIAERLALMQAVAAYKWRHQLPVEDATREQRVVEAAVSRALEKGLTTDSASRFFRAQIEGAKEIQHYWLARWRQRGIAPAEIPDLQTETRPALLALGQQIVDAVPRRSDDSPAKLAVLLETVKGLSPEAAAAIVAALDGLAFYPDRLTQVLDSGRLRVGTTGDYPPFSHRASRREPFQGIDIVMAEDLGTALGVDVQFVATSWPALMDDLVAGKFDIAMGGVSRTLERQKRGFFSMPYHVGGKTPICRCVDRERFTSLAAIDSAGVRVVVNPGGTNERFVDSRLSRAEKVLHLDNRTIFSVIAAGAADVMITDRIEADWQASQNPMLCTPLENNLTYQQKAYLMPGDIALKAFVDTWLELKIAAGDMDPLLTLP